MNSRGSFVLVGQIQNDDDDDDALANANSCFRRHVAAMNIVYSSSLSFHTFQKSSGFNWSNY